jgi:hypothetical protein
MATSMKLALALVVIGASAAIYMLGGYTGPIPVREIDRDSFRKVMVEIARKVFTKLFQLSQVTQRVMAVNPARGGEDAILRDDIGIEKLLDTVQSQVLQSHGLSVNDLIAAQSRFYQKGDSELERIIESVPMMFEQFVVGDFPVLPEYLVEIPKIDNEELLEKIDGNLNNKIESVIHGTVGSSPELSIEINNLISIKLNKNENNFKLKLFQIILKHQNTLKEHIETIQ